MYISCMNRCTGRGNGGVMANTLDTRLGICRKTPGNVSSCSVCRLRLDSLEVLISLCSYSSPIYQSMFRTTRAPSNHRQFAHDRSNVATGPSCWGASPALSLMPLSGHECTAICGARAQVCVALLRLQERCTGAHRHVQYRCCKDTVIQRSMIRGESVGRDEGHALL